ncbi:aldo/keto reductase [Pectobacterium polaris]|uniref:Aldo/keto reductase n=1 Tax=Pectobacterium polaris TaxID=2042057 RepID=A0AAW4NWF1_9GAMM|nr:aldo/keto reductase [Pectobacterium polaris]ASY78852.1 aldo/keto reductase [Pectobacterium polaris]MBW5891450.1 aldo/keto reductase [Pectobacterium polaris]MCU1796847.1 aldo/keto reductase [Pectobacterium polaris]
MEYRQLGKSGLRVSNLTLGTMTFGGKGFFDAAGSTGPDGAQRQIDMAIDAGINLIDTANMYSQGLSEELVGKAITNKRDKVLIASKVRYPMGDGPNDQGLTRHHLIEACEASLRRLKTDHIDLYQLHEWDGMTPLEETMAALDHLVHSGKVRYVGCSNFVGWQMVKAQSIAKAQGLTPLISQQIYLSLQERSAEYEIVPSAIDQGLGLLIWGPLASGWLSGKYRRNQSAAAGTRIAQNWPEPPIYDEDKLYDTIDVLVEIAEDRGISCAQVALAWLLSRPGITSVIVGARTDAQLADNLFAADLKLTEEEKNRLEKVSRPRLIYPHWHHQKGVSDRFNEADLSLHAPFLAERDRK